MTELPRGSSFFGHLGNRASALLDGQLSDEETQRAWAHVQVCHSCRDLVEREGWVKRRLAGLSSEVGQAPAHLKGSLLRPPPPPMVAPSGPPVVERSAGTWAGLAAVGGGALGAAVLGLLALNGPLDAPAERRPPITSIQSPPPTGSLVGPTAPRRTLAP